MHGVNVVSAEKLKAVADMAQKPETERRTNGAHRNGFSRLKVEEWLRDNGIDFKKKDKQSNGWDVYVLDECPFNSEHKSDANISQDTHGKLGFSCFHDGCSGKNWQDCKQAIGKPEPQHYDLPLNQPKNTAKRGNRSIKLNEDAPYQPFPTHLLPTPLREFVKAASEAMGCDPAYVALPLLAAIASAIGNKLRIELKPGSWSEPAVIWVVAVGYSGDLKSPALDAALRPIRERQNRAMRDYVKEIEEYEKADLIYQADLQAWKSSGRKNGEEPPEKPDEPIPWRCVVSDCTVEALAVLLNDQPNGLLMARDELAGWLGSHNEYKGGKGGDTANWLEMWRAGTVIVDRKGSGTKRPIYINRAAVSVCGTIQPVILQMALGREHFEDGLAARLLVAMPPRRKKKWTEKQISFTIIQQMDGLFDRLFNMECDRDEDGERVPKLVGFSPSGKTAWVEFYNRHAQTLSELSGDLSAAYAKLEAYCARFALLFHCVRSEAGDPNLESTTGIDASSVEAAASLVEWFGNEVQRIYCRLSETEEDRETRELVELISRNGSSITARELQKKSRQFATSEDAEDALQCLVKAGIGMWENAPAGPHGGRPTRTFLLKSGTSVGETPLKPEENRGFGFADTLDTFEIQPAVTTGESDSDIEEWGVV